MDDADEVVTMRELTALLAPEVSPKHRPERPLSEQGDRGRRWGHHGVQLEQPPKPQQG